MAKRHQCGTRGEKDVVGYDANGEEVAIGSIVEILEWPNDRYKGLMYVVGFDAAPGRGLRILVAATRWGKWDYVVSPARVRLRCFRPLRDKGE